MTGTAGGGGGGEGGKGGLFADFGGEGVGTGGGESYVMMPKGGLS